MYRVLEGNIKKFTFWVAVIASLFHLAMATGFIDLMPTTFRSIHLAFGLVLVFILYPSGKKEKKSGKVPFWDLVMVMVGLISSIYLIWYYEIGQDTLVNRMGDINTVEIILAVLTALIILEGTRRTIGWSIPIIILCFLFYSLYANYFPGPLAGRALSWERLLSYLYLSGNGIYGEILGISARYIFIFILFATFYQQSGAGKLVIDLCMGGFGSARGGPAKVSIWASALFGSLSGSAVANVMTTGSFTIPMMKNLGYSPRFAGAVEAAASTGGMFTPPVMGAAAFIMAEYLDVSYGTVIKAAFIPAFLYFIALTFAVDMEAQKYGLKGMPRNELPRVKESLRQGYLFLIPLIVLMYTLVGLNYSASRAALLSIITIIIIAVFKNRKEINLNKFLNMLEGGARTAIEIIVTSAAISILAGIVQITGLGVNLTGILIELSGGSLPLLLIITAIIALILGLGLTPTVIYITLAIMIAPSLIKMGVIPIAAHMFVFTYGIIGMITPPVAISAYAAATIAKGNLFATGITAFRLGFPAFIIPFMFVYGPELLMDGSVSAVILAIISSVIGIWALAGGLSGFMFAKVYWWQRVLLLVAALTLISTGTLTDLLGVALLLVVLVTNRYFTPRIAEKQSL